MSLSQVLLVPGLGDGITSLRALRPDVLLEAMPEYLGTHGAREFVAIDQGLFETSSGYDFSNDDLAICGHIELDDVTGSNPLCKVSGATASVMLSVEGGRLYLSITDDSSNSVTDYLSAAASIAADTRYFVAVNINRTSGEATAYIGTTVQTALDISSVTDDLTCTTRVEFGGDGTNYSDGTMYRWGLFGGTLTATELRWLQYGGLGQASADVQTHSTLGSKLLGYWNYNEQSSTDSLEDQFGSNDGAIVGAASIGVASGPEGSLVYDHSDSEYDGDCVNMSLSDWSRDVPGVANTSDGLSLRFDGTAEVAIPANFDFATEGTFACWVKVDDVTGANRQTLVWSATDSTNLWAVQIRSGTLRGGYYDGSYDSKSGAVSSGTWHHIAFVRRAGATELYIDGVAQTGSDVPGTGGSNGSKLGESDNQNRKLTGNLAGVRFFTRSLASSEISGLVSGSDTEDTTGLGPHYKFDEGYTGRVSDGSRNNSWRASRGNAIVYQTNATQQSTYESDEVNNRPGVLFNGTDLMTTASQISESNAGCVIIVWKPTSIAGTQTILSIGDEAGSANYLAIRTSTSGNGKVSVVTAGGSDSGTVSGDTVTAVDTPHYAIINNDGSSVEMWVDGVQQTLTGSATDWFGDMSAIDNTAIGGLKINAEQDHLAGYISQIMVRDTALTATEITQVNKGLGSIYA